MHPPVVEEAPRPGVQHAHNPRGGRQAHQVAAVGDRDGAHAPAPRAPQLPRLRREYIDAIRPLYIDQHCILW